MGQWALGGLCAAWLALAGCGNSTPAASATPDVTAIAELQHKIDALQRELNATNRATPVTSSDTVVQLQQENQSLRKKLSVAEQAASPTQLRDEYLALQRELVWAGIATIQSRIEPPGHPNGLGEKTIASLAPLLESITSWLAEITSAGTPDNTHNYKQRVGLLIGDGRWQNVSKVTIQAGDHIRIRAKGKWRCASDWRYHGPEGSSEAESFGDSRMFPVGKPMQLLFGVGIDPVNPRGMGDATEFIADQSGPLVLCPNVHGLGCSSGDDWQGPDGFMIVVIETWQP